MKTLAETFYNAITADAGIMEAVGGRVVSTCFEVPPGEEDNTPLPNIIITNDGFQHNSDTKDYVWEGLEDVVNATIDVAASSPSEVEQLVRKIRIAIEHYINEQAEQGHLTPWLQPGYPQAQPLSWDWLKPCYYQAIVYQCTQQADTDEEAE